MKTVTLRGIMADFLDSIKKPFKSTLSNNLKPNEHDINLRNKTQRE